VGRTARAQATGEALTLVTPEDEDDVRRIERALGSKIPRVVLPDFEYGGAGDAPLEIPLGERLAEMRAQKSRGRGRSSNGKPATKRSGGSSTKRSGGAPAKRSDSAPVAKAPKASSGKGPRRGRLGRRIP
jgi:ATP-dependent RNA helicase RhlE